MSDTDKISKQGEQALRYNQGKPELSYMLHANYAIQGMCEVMTFGARKYNKLNWQKPFDKDQLIDSLLRHLMAYTNGEEYDKESKLHHLDHVMCNSMFLSYHYNKRKPVDE